jgi:hypothetical protein
MDVAADAEQPVRLRERRVREEVLARNPVDGHAGTLASTMGVMLGASR